MGLRLIIRNVETGESLPPVDLDKPGGRVSIGRNARNDVVLPDPDRIISNSHAHIDLAGPHPQLVDTSANGVTLNSIALKKQHPEALTSGDVIRIGRYEICAEETATLDKTRLAPSGSPVPDFKADPLLPVDPFKIDRGGRREPLLPDDPLQSLDSGIASLLPSEPPRVPAAGDAAAIPDDPMRQFDEPARVKDDPFDLISHPKPEVDPFVGPSQRTGGSPLEAFFQPDELVPDPAYASAKTSDDDWDNWLPDAAPDGVEPEGQSPEVDADPFAISKTPSASPPGTSSFPKIEPKATPRPSDQVAAPAVPSAFSAPVDSVPATPPARTRAAAQATPGGPAATSASVPKAAPRSDASTGLSSAEMEAFLSGLGVDPTQLPDAATLNAMGAALRMLLTGMINAMRTRADVKNQLRLDRTMIQAQNNNPIKSATTVDDALELMFFHPRSGFLAPVEAVADTVEDLQLHETAMISGLKSASVYLIEQLDPARLEKSFAGGAGFGFRKKGNWEQFQEFYQRELIDKDLFDRAFSQGYDQAIRAFKRGGKK